MSRLLLLAERVREFQDGRDFERVEVLEEVQLVVGVLLLVYFFSVVMMLLDYILYSTGLYGVAKNHNVDSAGLAWIPVARQWVKGSIVDYYAKERKYDTKWRVILPVFACIPFVLVIAFYIVVFAIMLPISGEMAQINEVDDRIVTLLIAFFAVYISLLLALVINNASNIICNYKIFEEIVPKRAVLFTFLSLLLPFAHGICLLVCKKYGVGIKSNVQEPIFGDTVSFAPVAEPVIQNRAVEEPENTPAETVVSNIAAEEPVAEEVIPEETADTEVSAETVAENTENTDDSDIFTE